jgi:DNA-binding IclR family transcriptional regulator
MVKSVEKTFDILEYLAENQHPASLGDISEKLKSNKSTVRRFLVTLKELGYVEQDPDSRLYNLSHKIVWLGKGMKEDSSLPSIARPYMDFLAHETGETINLGILEEARVRYIDKRESLHRLRLCVDVGGVAPFHATALGKSILAFSAKEVLDRIITSDIELSKLTEHTITTWAELNQELAQIREDGVAYDRQELIDGLYCVGAPIMWNGNVIAAMSISTPITRMNEPRKALFVQLVREQTCKLGEELSMSRTFSLRND